MIRSMPFRMHLCRYPMGISRHFDDLTYIIIKGTSVDSRFWPKGLDSAMLSQSFNVRSFIFTRIKYLLKIVRIELRPNIN